MAGPAYGTAETDSQGAGCPGGDLEGARPMNELGIAVAWSALQVTLLLMFAGGLYVALARCRPGAASFVVKASLGVILGLTGLAFVPLPCWWDFRAGFRGTPEATND